MLKAVAAFIAAMPALGIAADLDAPLTPQPPTLRSEISRGADAAFDCELKNDGAAEAEVSGYYQCIEDVSSANRQRLGQGYEAFNAGLYARAERQLGIVQQVWSTSALAHDIAGLQNEINVVRAGYAEALAALHITDADVKQAIP